MERNTIQYTPSELSSMLEEGFAEIYKPFANYQRKQHPLWQKCIETISQHSILDKIIFCNDVVYLPPTKLFLCLHPEVAEDKNLSACDKKFVGCFWSYLFTTIFCYKFKKQVGINNPCIKTALYQKLKEFQSAENTNSTKEVSEMSTNLEEVNSQIANIVRAIENGFFQESFKVRMTELEEQKQALEIAIHQHVIRNTEVEITEDNLKKLFSMFKQFVTEKNIPECKKFIDSYVDKVLIFKDHLEVTFKVAFSFERKENVYSFKSSVKISSLFNTYRNAVGM